MQQARIATQSSITRPPSWGMGITWILSTALAGTLGLILADALVIGSPHYMFQGDSAAITLALWATGLGILIGLLIGLVQGAILWGRGQIKKSGLWVLASLAGVILGEMVQMLSL